MSEIGNIRMLQFKKREILYSMKTHKFIKKSFVRKIPNNLILEIIKYVGFNEICFNPYNTLYNYSKYLARFKYCNLKQTSKHNCSIDVEMSD